MYRISKSFTFEASHQLEGLPQGHQCGRMHGHSYGVELTFVSYELTAEGWMFDFSELAAFKKILDENFDHRHLNDVIDIQPTSENLARVLFLMAKALMNDGDIGSNAPAGTYLEKVRVSETAKTFAEYFEV